MSFVESLVGLPTTAEHGLYWLSGRTVKLMKTRYLTLTSYKRYHELVQCSYSTARSEEFDGRQINDDDTAYDDRKGAERIGVILVGLVEKGFTGDFNWKYGIERVDLRHFGCVEVVYAIVLGR